jgi:uncharacterized membrane protein
MKQSLLLFALVLSGLFNVFFVAGYLKARAEAAPDVTVAVGRELGLDTTQAALFKQLRETGHADAELYKDSITLVRRELVDELNADHDPERVAEIVDREADLRRQWRQGEAKRFTDFVGSLEPQQRRALHSRMNHAVSKQERHESLLRRFDANGDGVLDEQERRAARAHMQTRRAERERRGRNGFGGPPGMDRRGSRSSGMDRRVRHELFRRFDANGDGQLDAQEQAALLVWVAEGAPG